MMMMIDGVGLCYDVMNFFFIIYSERAAFCTT